MRAISVHEDTQVAEARRAAVFQAQTLGFDQANQGRVAIACTELATNLIKHGGGGELLIEAFADGAEAGVELMALDRGPGIADVNAALRDGHSTSGTPGNGLGAVSRQANVFDIYSRPGAGSAILARLYPTSDPRRAIRAPRASAVCLPKLGEEACGDAWWVREDGLGLGLIVVDGPGHGPLAATAAHEAIKVYKASNGLDGTETIARIHQALRPTRGAAASIASLPDTGDRIEFIGVGNVAGVIVSGREARRMVCLNGTLGHAMKAARPFSYDAPGDVILVLASDGLGTNWSLDAYPGLQQRHPSLIAGVLYRDFARGRDDVTVLVAKRAA